MWALDAAFDFFAVFEHDDHRGLRLNLLLQVEELRVVVLGLVVGREGRETDGNRGWWEFSGARPGFDVFGGSGFEERCQSGLSSCSGELGQAGRTG